MNRFLIILILVLVAYQSARGSVTKMNAQVSVYLHCDNPRLALAIIGVESSFQNVVSQEGSTGLMQVKPSTASWIGCSARTRAQLMDPDKNIQCGCQYLRLQAKRYSRLHDLVASYNAGSARRCKTGFLNPSGKSCIIGQYINQEYVNKVGRAYVKARTEHSR